MKRDRRPSNPVVLTKPHDRLLDVAIRLFLDEGIQAVGIRRIVAQAEVALMTAYRQFGDKDGLVVAALQQWSGRWFERVMHQVDGCGDDPEARFTVLWNALEEWLASEAFRGSLIEMAATELRGKPEHPAWTAIVEHRMAVRQLLEDLVKPLGAADPLRLAAQLHIIVEGATAVWVAGRPAGDPSFRALVDAVVRADGAS